MEKGLRFAIREGGRTVGAGTDQRDYSVRSWYVTTQINNCQNW